MQTILLALVSRGFLNYQIGKRALLEKWTHGTAHYTKMSQPTVPFGGGNVMVWGCFSAYTTGIISTSSFTHALWSWNLCDRAAWADTNAHPLGTRFYPGPVSLSEHKKLWSLQLSERACQQRGSGRIEIYKGEENGQSVHNDVNNMSSNYKERLAEARRCPDSPNDLGDAEGFANKWENNDNPV